MKSAMVSQSQGKSENTRDLPSERHQSFKVPPPPLGGKSNNDKSQPTYDEKTPLLFLPMLKLKRSLSACLAESCFSEGRSALEEVRAPSLPL